MTEDEPPHVLLLFTADEHVGPVLAAGPRETWLETVEEVFATVADAFTVEVWPVGAVGVAVAGDMARMYRRTKQGTEEVPEPAHLTPAMRQRMFEQLSGLREGKNRPGVAGTVD